MKKKPEKKPVVAVTTQWDAAVEDARRMAADGSRVASILEDRTKPGTYAAVPGFMDRDTTGLIKQVALITPNGRVWERATIDRDGRAWLRVTDDARGASREVPEGR
jgi:hypothetical protein